MNSLVANVDRSYLCLFVEITSLLIFVLRCGMLYLRGRVFVCVCVCDKCFVDVVVLVAFVVRLVKRERLSYVVLVFWLGSASKECRRLFYKLIQLFSNYLSNDFL